MPAVYFSKFSVQADVLLLVEAAAFCRHGTARPIAQSRCQHILGAMRKREDAFLCRCSRRMLAAGGLSTFASLAEGFLCRALCDQTLL